jgi:hypothetical protein
MIKTRFYPHRIFNQEFRRLAKINIEFSSCLESPFDYQVYRPVISSTMEQQMMYTVVKEELKTLPKFGGGEHEDVVKWLKKVNEVFDQAQLQSNNKYLAVQSYLTDTAAKWFSYNKTTINDWSKFQQEIIKTYRPSLDQLLLRMEQRQQSSDEPVAVYYYDKLHLCLQVDSTMSSMMSLHYLTKGLKPSLIAHVLRRQPSTPADFLVIAESEEKIQATLNSLTRDPLDDRHYLAANDLPDDIVTLVKHPDNLVLGSDYQRPPRQSYPPPLMNLPYVPPYPSSNLRYSTPRTSARYSAPPSAAPRYPSQTSSSPLASRQCYACSRLGHLAKYCPNRKNF